MCGSLAQLVEHHTGIAEVTGSNPVEALIFFRLLLSNCLNWKIYCDDHCSLSLWYILSCQTFILFSLENDMESSKRCVKLFRLFLSLDVKQNLILFECSAVVTKRATTVTSLYSPD